MKNSTMRYRPGSLLLIVLALVLFACGGDGGDGQVSGGDVGEGIPPTATLTGLSINGPSRMSAHETATYTATASWSDNTTSVVEPTWSVVSYVASITPGGALSCDYPDIVYDEPATVTATYFSGGINKTATMFVTIAGGGESVAALTSLTINGPSSMSEYAIATYSATASWSDGSTSAVTPTWSVTPQVAGINTEGALYCQGGVSSDQTVTITATYSSGGVTKTATMVVTITDTSSIPFIDEELSGKAFFEEYASGGGGYSSFLHILNNDSSLDVYATFALPRGATSYYVTGTWSNDPYGLDLNRTFADYAPSTVQRIADSPTEMQVVIYDEFWGWWSSVVTWEKTVPVDPAKVPGTYTQSIDGYTWVFNADGTGTVTIQGGTIFTWSVGSDGVLRVSSSTGYSAVLYARATSQSTATEYTILRVGLVEVTQTGAFREYDGGYELTRR